MPETRSPENSEMVPETGDLQTTSFVRLYFLAVQNSANGLFTLHLGDRNLKIHFRKGSPDFIDSDFKDDSWGSFLQRQGLVNADQLGRADSEKAKFGGELLPALFGLGIVNPNSAMSAMVLRANTILIQAARAFFGAFTFVNKDLPAHQATPLGNKWTIWTDMVRRMSAQELQARFGEDMAAPVLKSGSSASIQDFRLSPQEMRAFAAFDGVRSLDQYIEAIPTEADHFLRTAFLLKAAGAIHFGEFLGTKVPPSSSSHRRLRPRPRASSPPPGGPPVLRPAGAPPIVEKSPPRPSAPPHPVTNSAPVPAPPPPPAAVAVAPPVGVAPAPAPAPKIERPPEPKVAPPVIAAGKPAPPKPAPPKPAPAKPAPASQPPPAAVRKQAAPTVVVPQDYTTQLRDLEALVQRAREQNYFELLGVPPTTAAADIKVAYFKLARIYHPDTVPPEAPDALKKLKADHFAKIGQAYRTLSEENTRRDYEDELKHGPVDIDLNKILAAEELFYKACSLVKVRKFPEALKFLDEAIEANPDEAEYYGWRGYARYFTIPDKKLAYLDAMKDIDRCLKKTEKVAQIWYFQGHLAKLHGDMAAAKRHFQKCIELAKDHIDAQRELRLLK